MRSLGQSALTLSLAAALLVGCGGSQLPIAANITSAGTHARSHHRTFKYTGSEQSFKVPAGVTHVKVVATGGGGSPGNPPYNTYSRTSGGGPAVTLAATIPVTPGERLAIFVGGSGSTGGFNGGSGPTCEPGHPCYGWGGGASDVRQGGDRLADRVVVGAGGGGGGSDGCQGSNYPYCNHYTLGGYGGSGGGKHRGSGGSGSSGSGERFGSGGTGGTERHGGKGGAGGVSYCGGSDGKRGVGGAGGGSSFKYNCRAVGGGGGGGYYGGGGGGAGTAYGSSYQTDGSGGGGGGGASFAESSATHVQMRAGTSNGNGVIEITW